MQASLSQQCLSKTVDSSLCHIEINNYFRQELEMPPPPYKSELNDECLPRYMESPSSMDLEDILDRFALGRDNQRIVHHHFCNSDTKRSYSSTDNTDHTGQLLDRMRVYRHTDQEWRSLNHTKMNRVIQNMYHIKQHSSAANPKSTKKRQSSYLSPAKSVYQKMILSIAKERDHFIQQVKKLQLSSSNSTNCIDELDFILNYIHDTTCQSQMSNQRATITPTI